MYHLTSLNEYAVVLDYLHPRQPRPHVLVVSPMVSWNPSTPGPALWKTGSAHRLRMRIGTPLYLEMS